MKIYNLAQQAWNSAVSYFEPKPVAWDDFSVMLTDPENWIGARFVKNFSEFKNQPAYKGELVSMAARSCGVSHVFVDVKGDGRVDIITLVANSFVVAWQSKPDGSSYRGTGFRDMQQGQCITQVNEALEQCFADLSENPELAGAITLAWQSYNSDAAVFERDPGTLDNLVYGRR